MKITVCVKQVPDTGTDRELRQDDSTVAREAADAVVPQLTDEISRRGQEG
jgi:electron transfer flavoprotein beta subunit